ncbi:MAG: DUF421 domain-containing protein [Oscillospiraceae bacterium]|nr:DUF421 domain-containing protein [Oscillospiraceae bacterium]
MILSYIRALVLYLVLTVVIRLLGKRQVGQMEPTELVVAMLAADLVSVPMQDSGIPLFSGLVPVLTVLGIEMIFSWLSMHSVKLRKLLCGKPVILIENGRILQSNLRRTGVTMDELSSHLRQKDVLDISSVQYAILETDGNLSVFPFAKHLPASAADAGIRAKVQFLPVTIISDGYFFRENLASARKDEAWVRQVLRQRGATVEGTWLLTVDAAGHVLWLGKEQAT